ncbi:MAG: OsmC family protein [Caulobacteraceae bacterium]|nr:OsmC family protein [Caulobacteraceae bacterium]
MLGTYQVELRLGPHVIIADEPAEVGGQGSGPSPFDLLCGALCACTSMTLRMYANRKAWPLERVLVQVAHRRDAEAQRDVFDRRITLQGPLDEIQTQKLLDIAQRCPVHRALSENSLVLTELDAA